MASRIPTPALRGQEVGSVQSQFTPTPFQNLSPDADVFGAGQARMLQQASAGLSSAADDLMTQATSDDKLALTKFETEVKQQQLAENARISALVGQEQRDAADAAPGAFSKFVAAAQAKHAFQLTSSTAAAEDFSALSQSQFSAAAVTASAAGKAVVDKQVSASRLVTANGNLTADPKQVAAFEGVVSSTVLDPDIGLAQAAGLNPSLITYSGTDPEKVQQKNLLENMIAEQQALGLRQVVDSLVAKGDLAGAVSFVDDNPQLGANTAGRIAAEAQVATFRQKVQAQQEFSAIISAGSSSGKPPTLAELYGTVAAEPDVDKRSRLLAEFSVYSSAATAALNESIKTQGAAFIADLAAGQSGEESLAKYPAYFAANPLAALGMPTKARAVAASNALSAEDEVYIAGKGGASNVPGLSNVLSRMFQSDPAEAARLIDGGQLKKYFDRTTYEGFQQQAGSVKEIASTRETKNPTNAGTVMRSYLGYTTAEIKNVMKLAGPRLTDAVYKVEQAAIAAGKPVDAEDVRKVVFENLVRIRTIDRWAINPLGDEYTVLSAVTQAQVDGGFDPYVARMGDGSANDRTLAFLFGKGVDEIVAAREALDDKDTEYSMNNLAAHFGLKSPPEARKAAENEQAMDNLSLNAGYPPDFVEYVIKSLRKPLDMDSAVQTIKDLNGGSTKGVSTKELLKAWAGTR